MDYRNGDETGGEKSSTRRKKRQKESERLKRVNAKRKRRNRNNGTSRKGNRKSSRRGKMNFGKKRKREKRRRNRNRKTKEQKMADEESDDNSGQDSQSRQTMRNAVLRDDSLQRFVSHRDRFVPSKSTDSENTDANDKADDIITMNKMVQLNKDFSHLLLFSNNNSPQRYSKIDQEESSVSSITKNNNAFIQIDQKQPRAFKGPFSLYGIRNSAYNGDQRGSLLAEPLMQTFPEQSKSSVFDKFRMMDEKGSQDKYEPTPTPYDSEFGIDDDQSLWTNKQLSTLSMNNQIQVAIQVLPYNDDPTVHLVPYDPPIDNKTRDKLEKNVKKLEEGKEQFGNLPLFEWTPTQPSTWIASSSEEQNVSDKMGKGSDFRIGDIGLLDPSNDFEEEDRNLYDIEMDKEFDANNLHDEERARGDVTNSNEEDPVDYDYYRGTRGDEGKSLSKVLRLETYIFANHLKFAGMCF